MQVLLCNECFSSFIWPMWEFLAASVIITIFYTLIVFKNQVPIALLLIMTSINFIAICALCLIMDLGSVCGRESRFMRARFKQISSSQLCRLVFRSCPPLEMKVGDFHKMDRQRSPVLMRFILQRTLTLVVNTSPDIKEAALL